MPPANTAPLRLWRFAPLIAFGALGVAFAYMLFNNSGGALPSALIGRPSPAFTLPVLDRSGTAGEAGLAEGQLSNQDFGGGRVSILNLWASWCAPCRVEHPQLMALAARDDVDVYGVAFQDEPAASARFLRELGDPFDKVGVDRDGQAALRWGVEGVPETFLIDAEGRVVHKITGALTPEILRETLIPAILRANDDRTGE